MMTTDATGFPDYTVEETKAGAPQFVLDRLKQQLSDLTIQSAESRQQALPGYIPPPPTPLESLGD